VLVYENILGVLESSQASGRRVVTLPPPFKLWYGCTQVTTLSIAALLFSLPPINQFLSIFAVSNNA
jgi:hypothetical protein